MAKATPEERFWLKVRKTETCWLWTAFRQPDGYGRFRWPGGQLAHRFAYELLIGPISDGLTLDHLCRNPSCVNPAHLEQVSRGENVLRGDTLQAANKRKTCCHKGHPLAGDNLFIDGHGMRQCRICARERDHNYRQRKRR